MILSPAAQLGAARAYAQRAAVIRRTLGDAAVAQYDRLEDYSQIDAFLDAIVPLTIAAQRALASILLGYLAVVSGTRGLHLDPEEVSGEAVRGTDMREDWSIPSRSLWAALGAGVAFTAAYAAARDDVRTKATTDLAFTQADAMARLSEQVEGMYGYRRVLMGEGCDFCITAADQTYNVGDLMPLHAGCNCAVAPLMLTERGVVDPAETLNDSMLGEGGP